MADENFAEDMTIAEPAKPVISTEDEIAQLKQLLVAQSEEMKANRALIAELTKQVTALQAPAAAPAAPAKEPEPVLSDQDRAYLLVLKEWGIEPKKKE